MTTTQIRYFLEAAEALSFTAAAEHLYISQSTVSRSIAALEAELGTALFERKNNALVLTAGGEVFLNGLPRLQTELNALKRRAAAANGQQTDGLVLASIRGELPDELLANAVRLYRNRFPQRELRMLRESSVDILKGLKDRQIDLAVLYSSAVDGEPDIRTDELCTYPSYLVMSRQHPLAGTDRASLSDFSENCFISVRSTRMPHMSGLVTALCEKVGFTPLLIEADSPEQQMEWVEEGKGVALSVPNHVERANPLFHFLELSETFPRRFLLAYHRENGEKIAGFRKIILSLCPGA